MTVLLGLLWVVVFLVGLVIGWAWKPKWVFAGADKFNYCFSKFSDSSCLSSGCRLLVDALKGLVSSSSFNSFMVSNPNGEPVPVNDSVEDIPNTLCPAKHEQHSSSQLNEETSRIANLLTEEDLKHLHQLVEMKDGGPAWIQMMDRSTPGMSYRAWRRDPQSGPPQYGSRTVFENATPEVVRDFFWDDEFRAKWDDMLAYSATVEECTLTGTMIAQWIRKFPFFCSDREYIIGRRIWESDGSYYCVSKGVPCPSVPRRDKPRRVDLYYSSWYIRAVESSKGDYQLTACEVLLFHYEDMGIPWEIAKLGVRHGMWGTVKRLEPALRAYQKSRASQTSLSRYAIMPPITTKINPQFLTSMEVNKNSTETEAATSNSPLHRNITKFMIVGGAIAVACSIDKGLLIKAFIFGVARRFANIGKRL